jgi:hypothetical protein
MPRPKKSRTRGELIPCVIFEFSGMPDLYFTKDQYKDEGGYRGILKSMCLSIRDIIKAHHIILNPSDWPTEDWQG